VSVVSHTNAAGDVSIGVEVEGAYVPFVTLSRAKVAQYVQRGHDLQARAEAGDGRSLDVLGSAFKEKAKGRGAKASEGEAK
jgi:hypothetical protein